MAQKTSAPPVVGDPQEAGHSHGLCLTLEGGRGGPVTLSRAGLCALCTLRLTETSVAYKPMWLGGQDPPGPEVGRPGLNPNSTMN